MTVQSNGTGPSGRRAKRFLSPSEKFFQIWLSLVRGEYTISEAADRSGVDRSTVMKLRTVAPPGRAGCAGGLRSPGCGRAAAQIRSWRRRGRRSPGCRRR